MTLDVLYSKVKVIVEIDHRFKRRNNTPFLANTNLSSQTGKVQ